MQPKIVLHIDASGSADEITFGIGAPPYVVVRVQPMPGDLSRFVVFSSDPDDETTEDIVHTASIPGRIVDTSRPFLSALL